MLARVARHAATVRVARQARAFCAVADQDSIVKGISSGADYGDDKIFLESEYGKIQKVKNLFFLIIY